MSAVGGRKRGERRFCPTRGCFLLLLYDKAIACMQEAIELLDAGDPVARSERLSRAQDIVMELSDSLDRSTGAIVYESLTPVEANVYLRPFRRRGNHDRV